MTHNKKLQNEAVRLRRQVGAGVLHSEILCGISSVLKPINSDRAHVVITVVIDGKPQAGKMYL